MIISTYDCRVAIESYLMKNNGSIKQPFDVISIDIIDDDKLFVQTTNFGNFICKTFEDEYAKVYMEVHEVYEPLDIISN